jgi:hypothetical protein
MAGGDPAAQGQDSAGDGDQALAGEGQGGEELSDQELHQIYAGMDPADLERHYMVIRSVLRTAYQKFEKSESQPTKEDDMDKQEKAKLEKQIAELQKSNKEMEESLTGAIKAVEILAKPTRKAVVSDVQVLGKGEAQNQPAAGSDFSGLSKAEVVQKINGKVRDPKLTKSDRDTLNRYVLSKTEEGRSEVLAILGGKQ